MANIAELLLRITGDSSGAVEAAAEADAALASVGTSADTTRGKLDETSSSSERTGAAFRDTARETENLGRSVDDTNAKHQSFIGTLGSVVSWLTGSGRATSDFGRATEDAGRSVHDTDTATKDAGKTFDDVASKIDKVGGLLSFLGVGGGQGEEGIKGVTSALDGAVTGFSTFTPAASFGQKALSGIAMAGAVLIPLIIGITVVLSPAIAALLTFTVALTAAIGVMTLGVGVLGAGAAGIVMLAAKTQNWGAATANVTTAQSALQTATTANTSAQTALARAHASTAGTAQLSASQQLSLTTAQQNATAASQKLTAAQQGLTLAQQSAQNPLVTLENSAKSMADTLGKAAVPTAGLILAWVNTFIPTVQRMGMTVLEWFQQRMPAALSFFGGMVNTLFGALTKLGQAIGRVVDDMLAHAPQFQGLWSSVLGVVVGAVSGLLDNMVKLSNWFFQTLPAFQPFISATFGGLGLVLMGTMKFVGNLGLAFVQVFDTLKAGQGSIGTITAALEKMGVPGKAAAGAAQSLGTAFSLLKTILSDAWSVLGPFAKAFIDTFVSAYSGGGFSKMLGQIQAALGPFVSALQQVAPAIGTIAGTILSANLISVVEQIVPKMIQLATVLVQALTPALQGIAAHASQLYPVLIALGVAFAAFKIVQTLSGAFTALSSAVRTGQMAMEGYRAVQAGMLTAEEAYQGVAERGIAQAALMRAALLARAVAQGIQTAATWVGTTAASAFAAVEMLGLLPIILIIAGIIALVAVIVLVVTHWRQVSAVLTEVWDKIKQFASWIGGEFVQAWSAAISAVGQFFSSLGTRVRQGLTTIFNDLKALASQWWPLLLLVLPGGALVALVVLIVTHWSQIKQHFTEGFNAVRGFISTFWSWAMGLWQGALEFVHNLLLSFVNREIQGWLNIFNWVRTTASDFWNWGRNLFQAAYEFVHALLLNWINREIQGWLNIFDWIRSTASGFWDWIRGTWQTAFDWVRNLILGEFDKWRSGFQTVFDDIRSKVTSWISDLQGMFTGLATNLAATLGGIASNIGSKLHDGLNAALGFVDTFDKDVNDLVGKVGVTLTLPTDLKLAGGGVVAAFAAGGMVLAALGGTLPGYAPGQDTVHALLSPGEGVLTPQATRGIGGGPAINAINAAFAAGGVVNSAAQALSGPLRLPAFAGGGIVGSVGGECVVFVEQQEGHHFPVEYANQMTQYINSHTPAVGEIFVSTISPDGHTGIINGPNSVIDSNWNLDGVVHVHPLSDIPDIAGYINLGQPLPAGLPGGNGGPGGAAALLSSLLSGPEGVLKSAVSGVGGIAGQFAGGVVQKMIDGINSLGGSSSGGSYTGGGNVGAWITAGLLAAGKPLSWLGDMETIAHYESSDNPNANQGLNGSGNALGLMQTVQATFNAYVPAALKALGIFNPEADAAASANYIASRYGDPSRTPGILSLAAGGPYRGYANGGIAVTPQIATLAERGPEMVSPYRPGGSSSEAAQTALLQQIADYLSQIATPQASPVNSLSAQLRHPH